MLETAAESAREQVKITSIKAMQVGAGTWIRIETDQGFVGHGPGGPSGVVARPFQFCWVAISEIGFSSTPTVVEATFSAARSGVTGHKR
jgi:hypothetical protein